jgi:hypothetical protein
MKSRASMKDNKKKICSKIKAAADIPSVDNEGLGVW